MKRFLCVVFVAALLVLCAACSRQAFSNVPEPTAAPTASSSRNLSREAARSEPVIVDETYANSDNVSPATQAPATAEQPAVDTPETGDFPRAVPDWGAGACVDLFGRPVAAAPYLKP